MPKRFQLRRTAGYKKPEGALNVTRGGRGRFGNPYEIGEMVTINGPGWATTLPLTRDQAVALFRNDVLWHIREPVAGEFAMQADTDAVAEERAYWLGLLAEARGRDVACYCHPADNCHGDVWLELANATPAKLARLVRAQAAMFD